MRLRKGGIVVNLKSRRSLSLGGRDCWETGFTRGSLLPPFIDAGRGCFLYHWLIQTLQHKLRSVIVPGRLGLLPDPSALLIVPISSPSKHYSMATAEKITGGTLPSDK